MKDKDKIPTDTDIEKIRERRLEAMHLQEMEGNPLSPEQIAMFEMFEEKRWTEEQCIEHIRQRAQKLAKRSAAPNE
ncbi:hypothetical protein [Halocynthiibacter styelae]|uniref:Antitoxin VbhA domain-containing protein n=1 Tax=Halocynthiibacter styelae TaxID=2761955 RepID=A0A8J7J2S1_9RHOB|nr:hypothetical protein [Paenihalocynthiibacter styelae]MBI1492015.1 hypothetical protein [Paenihalocynthiibacter styelae]